MTHEAFRDKTARDLFRLQHRARRADQGPARHSANRTRGRIDLRRPGTVRTRRGRRLSRRAARGCDLEYRNVRRDEAADRQLALGRRAVLPPDRQAHAAAGHRNRHPVHARAFQVVPRYAGRAPLAQSAGHAHPAGRGHHVAVRVPRCLVRSSGSVRSTWTSPTPTTSAPRRAPATSDCCMTRCAATPRCFSVAIWWKRRGMSSARSSMSGRRCQRAAFPTTRRARGSGAGRRAAPARRATVAGDSAITLA